jgi:glycosyltransferase involved in cell wall biosynthesis
MSEGLPMSLLEYGAAGLATVATQVGQCADVLDNGMAGFCVPPGSPKELAAALISLLRSDEQRKSFGQKFQERVEAKFSPKAVMGKLSAIYDKVLTGNGSSQCAAGVNATRDAAVTGTTNEEFSH